MSIYTDLPWLYRSYSKQDVEQLLGLLLSLNADTHFLKTLAHSLFNLDDNSYSLCATPLEKIKTLKEHFLHDFLLLAIIYALYDRANMKTHLSKLLDVWPKAQLSQHIAEILLLLKKGQIKKLKDPMLLGEGYQNLAARENGIAISGWFEYKKQMHSMTSANEYLPLKEKYAFLNTLPENTLGGQLTKALRKESLNLPGEEHGFAEFFLWHDLSHVLSGNGTDLKGELGANIFTAAYSKKGKFKIMLFGLLQWQLDIPLAIVAPSAKDALNGPLALTQYFQSLHSGSECTMDLLDWPINTMLKDLKTPINTVRQHYNILPLSGACHA